MDLIYMVLKGKVAFYGPDDKVIGEDGPHEGLLLPENSRYWFGAIGDEEAWLLQIAGYPKGAEMSQRIPVTQARTDAGGVWGGKIGNAPGEGGVVMVVWVRVVAVWLKKKQEEKKKK